VSVVTYTGNGTAGQSVGHGLGVAPKMIIFKCRTQAVMWPVYHAGMAAFGGSAYVQLQSTAAYVNDSTMFSVPTSTVLNIGNNTNINTNTATYVAYCFSEIAGFSKFGSYTGNGSADGVFVYTGFRPKFVMLKRTDVAGAGWQINDTSRDSYNIASQILVANVSDAEATFGTIDILSNGFKLRTTAAGLNASGSTQIFMAFSENPFAQANAR
jgi:hypothetical protein